ncbi:radical SAM protein [Patescibacteria group bacterium]|nr:radical SAM protein [Patescibacteria group bacterium]MCG2694672.1 radical SAM protein [Candidatus Parcubacteria bacterium]
MSEKILCRVEPYLNDKILFSLDGSILALERKDLGYIKENNLFLVENKVSFPDKLSAPLVVQIQTTNRCNFSCKHCYSKSGKSYPDEMSNKDIMKLLVDLRDWGVLKIQWVGGEVFTKNGFWDLVECSHSLGFEQSLLTNGTYFGSIKNLKMIDDAWNYFYTIQVSVDDYGKNFDKFVRRKAWAIVCESIDRLSHSKPKNRVLSVATVVRQDNIKSISKIASLLEGKIDVLRLGKEIVTGRSQEAQEYSIDALFKSWYLIQKIRIKNSSLRISHPFDKIEEDKEEVPLLPFDWKSDNGARTFMYISAKGLAYPFPLLVNIKGFCAGSVFSQNLSSIWNSLPFERYRSVTRKETGCGECQKSCQIWPRYHFIVGDNLDLRTKPFSHPGCPFFK